MKKIKLMHVQLQPLLSGVQNMMLTLLGGLEKEKYEIYVLSRGHGELVNKVRDMGFIHISLQNFVSEISWFDFHVALQLVKIFWFIKPDIVHTHSSKPGFLGRIIARLMGISLIIHTVHGFSFHAQQSGIKFWFYQKLEQFAANFAHYNVMVNNRDREYAITTLGFDPQKTITIYNGISPGKKKKYPFLRQKRFHDINKNDVHALQIVSVCRFTAQKNISQTLKQATQIVKSLSGITFTFYGDGELFSECQNHVQKNNNTERIILKGWQNNIIAELPQYDVFLLNSAWEGLSIAILEAMSVGLPIICSRINGNLELVDQSNGWLIEPFDDKGIRNVLEEIIIDPNLLAIKGNNSYNKVTNQFHQELFISKYNQIYDLCKEK